MVYDAYLDNLKRQWSVVRTFTLKLFAMEYLTCLAISVVHI